jgi:hypothetical protein
LAVRDAAISTSDAMCCGAVQLTPTATICAQPSSASTHAASGSPWLTCTPSRHEKLIHACIWGKMHLADQFGRVEQQLCRPQRVVQVGAASLELGREPAVDDHDAVLSEQLVEPRHRLNFSASASGAATPLVPDEDRRPNAPPPASRPLRCRG